MELPSDGVKVPDIMYVSRQAVVKQDESNSQKGLRDELPIRLQPEFAMHIEGIRNIH